MAVAAAGPPLELTASDGAGLELVSLSAQAVVEDPLAFTELHLVFRNPESRTREGRFRITLPSGATVSRFAMRVGDRWQEGEVVEQQAARVAYEDFLHRRQDPALLEAEAGNEFSARVFPIPPNATKELIISYSQELRASGQPYRLPLVGLPRLRELAIRALVNRAVAAAGGPVSSLGGQRARTETIEVHKSQYKPDRDFEVAAATGGGSASRLGLRNDNLVVARIVPYAEAAKRDDVGSLLVLVDTSASRALGLADEIAAVERLLAGLRAAGDPSVTVAAFDQDVVPIYTGRASAVGSTMRERLVQRGALGASDLDRALGWVAGAAGKGKRARVLLVTDGVATAGATGADKLRGRVRSLASAGVERLDVLAVGGIREDALLARLATAGLPRDGVVLDATQPADRWVARLTRATRSGLKVEVEGAGWVWPSTLDGVQPGDEVLVYADLPANQAFHVKVAGAPLALAGSLASVERPLLERAWVRARIARLLEMRDAPEKTAGLDGDLAEALKKQAIDLSVKYRVLCPFTSLLVLESEQDYARFGIERRALADILTVGTGGIALVHRADFAVLASDSAGQSQPVEGSLARPVVGSLAGKRIRAAAESPASDERAMRPRPRADAPRRASEPMRESARRAPAKMDIGGHDLADTLSEADAHGELGGRGKGGSASAPSAGGAPLVAAAPLSSSAAPRAAARMAARPSDSSDKKAKVAAEAMVQDDRGAPASAPQIARQLPPPSPAPVLSAPLAPAPAYPASLPVSGPLKEILELVRRGDARRALSRALAWRSRDPGDVLALVALGEC